MKKALCWLTVSICLLVCASALAEIPAQYADCLYPARENGLWGYINYAGEMVIAPQFAYAREFRGAGYALVGTKKIGWNEDTWDVDSDEYWEKNGTEGIIDRSGAFVVAPKCIIEEGDHGWYLGGKDTGFYQVKGHEGAGFFDVATGFFSGLRYADTFPYGDADSRLVPVAMDTGDQWNYVGYADRATGEIVIPCIYGDLSCGGGIFRGGLVCVWMLDGEGEPVKYRLLDEKNNIVPLPDGMVPVVGGEGGGLAVVYEIKSGLYGYADAAGNMVVSPRFSEAWAFEDGVAEVKLASGETRYIDRQGNFAAEPEKRPTFSFDDQDNLCAPDKTVIVPASAGYKIDNDYGPEAGDYFAEGAQAFYQEQGGKKKFGFIDAAGAVVVPFVFDDAANYIHSLARVEKDGVMAYIDHTGAVVWQGKQQQIRDDEGL